MIPLVIPKPLQEYRTYRVRWPDGSVEIVFAPDDRSLFFLLWEDSDPTEALEIEEINLPPLRISARRFKRAIGDVLKAETIRKINPADFVCIVDFLPKPTVH